MKTSGIVASVLFGSMAAAAPMLNKRAYVTHTSTLIQTEVTYTTVYADEVAPQASGAFFEQKGGKPPVSPPATTSLPSTTAVPVSVPTAGRPSSIAKPSSSSSSRQLPPVPTTTQAPPKTTSQPPVVQPTSTKVQPQPQQPSTSAVVPSVPVASSVAPAPQPSASAPSTGGGQAQSGGSMTIHPFGGATGSCGSPIQDSDMAVALANDLYGDNVWVNGQNANKYCGMDIKITYNGKTVPAKIMDRCPGCTNGGLDVSQAIWDQLVGAPGDRLYGMTWSPA